MCQFAKCLHGLFVMYTLFVFCILTYGLMKLMHELCMLQYFLWQWQWTINLTYLLDYIFYVGHNTSHVIETNAILVKIHFAVLWHCFRMFWNYFMPFLAIVHCLSICKICVGPVIYLFMENYWAMGMLSYQVISKYCVAI